MKFPGYPTVVIAGAPKCGTSALFDYLAGHPDVCASSVKESYFLIDEGYPLYRGDRSIASQGLAGYARFFTHCANEPGVRVYLEATPDYMYQETALRTLATLESVPKVIFVLRKPAERVYSLYRFAQQNMAVLSPDVSFPQFLDRVERGDPALAGREILLNAINHSRYSVYLRRWLDALGPDRVKVLVFEDMVRAPRETLTQLCAWLGIAPEFYAEYVFEKRNESVVVRHHRLHYLRRKLAQALPPILKSRALRRLYDRLNIRRPRPGRCAEDQAAIERLARQFDGEAAVLSAMIGVDLSGWRIEPNGVPTPEAGAATAAS